MSHKIVLFGQLCRFILWEKHILKLNNKFFFSRITRILDKKNNNWHSSFKCGYCQQSKRLNKINILKQFCPQLFLPFQESPRFVFLPGTTSGGTMKEIQLTITKSPEGRYTCNNTGVLLLFISTWNFLIVFYLRS